MAQVTEAEHKLSRKFAPAYVDFLTKYGCVSVASLELIGLGGPKHLDVVNNTLELIAVDRHFPKNAVAIENVGIDGVYMLIDDTGRVFQYPNGKSQYRDLQSYINAAIADIGK